MLDALAVLAEVDDVATTRAAVQALQRRLGLAATGEITPALLQRAQAAAEAVHADAHARAAAAAETAAALYSQIAGDREREIEAMRARHPGRPTSLTEEEVGASRLAEARSALEAANHWRRAALGRERATQAEIDAPRNSGVSGHFVGATDASPTASDEDGRGASDSRQAAEAHGEDGRGASDSRQAAATEPAGVEQAQVLAARARARAWRAAEAAGPWFRSAAAGHLAAGDRLQGSRALEGALKAAALVAEATAPGEPWPSSHVPEDMFDQAE
ncbi:peptidoglycan-binding protein [Nannocystis pusilla]|uniref:Peptidoglycan-binding protein n=1 Tax=Nannocystis pusilla TaxID=889268 RepID=A0A9X3J2Z0_9BACT|nr:peptidoglycan-binding protein [Nannocystis pusilla]MCY1012269.1 peptidoglycan-binding protein [Nannocystis pusilla]